MYSTPPPVLGAIFIASGMIGGNWLRVVLTAMALGVGLCLIPLGMISNPDITTLTSLLFLAVLALAQKRGPLLRWGAFASGLLPILWQVS